MLQTLICRSHKWNFPAVHSQAKNQQLCHEINSFLTLQKEVETNGDPATKRKSFSLAQNILSVNYPNIFPEGA